MDQLDIIIPVTQEPVHLAFLLQHIDSILSSNQLQYHVIVLVSHSLSKNISRLKIKYSNYPIIVTENLTGLSLSDTVAVFDINSAYPLEIISRLIPLLSQHGLVLAANPASGNLISRLALGGAYDLNSGLLVLHREIISHLTSAEIIRSDRNFKFFHTALEMGYTIGSVRVYLQSHTSKKLNHTLSAIQLKLSRHRVYPISALGRDGFTGAGVAYKRRRFITHTSLPLEHSAVQTFYSWQKYLILSLAAAFISSLILFPYPTALTFVAVITTVYFFDVLFNLFLILKSLNFPPELSFTAADYSRLNRKNLPVYSILCPLYKEAQVLPAFVKHIKALDWPKNKLDVQLLLEENDTDTIEVARSLALPDYIHIRIVPNSQPKTKPKACNYGLAHTRGEYVVIYDAEDQPDPLQLQSAYLGFLASPAEVVCLQAKLNYYNPKTNLLTRFFTAEYSLWFDIVLPGLQSINTAIPLGGTSNHFRASVLKRLHGWDAFNVTEDCDLGARLFKLGYRTAIIDSTTLEEANSRWGNWLRQRSRWLKGYLQTFFVHNRHPLRFIKSHGWHAFIFQLVIGGKIAFMLINPFLWLATLSYFVLYSLVGPAIESLYPPLIFYLAVFSLVVGNFLFLYYYMVGCARRGHYGLIKYVFFIPLYWLMVSLAGFKAVYQLFAKPHYWEKTRHGLHLSPSPAAIPPRFSVSVNPRFPQAAFLVIASILANILNFLYNAYLGRSLNLEDFGLLTLIGSFLYIAQVPIVALSSTVTHRSAYLLGKYKYVATDFWSTVRRHMFFISLVITLMWSLAVPFLAAYFHVSNILPFVLFTPVWVIGSLLAVDNGFLNGTLKFGLLALSTLIEAGTKLALTFFLVQNHYSGYIYIALPVSSLMALTLTWIVIHSVSGQSPNLAKSHLNFPGKFFTTSIANRLSFVSFMTLDVMLARHYLSPVDAGLYSLMSLVGKMVYFGGSLLSQFVVPVVSHAEGAGTNSVKTFNRILIATVVASGLGFVGVGLLGRYTVTFLLGSKVIPILSLLPWYTLAMAAYAISLTVINFHQSRKSYLPTYFSLSFALVQVLAILLIHANLAQFTYLVATLSLMHLAGTLLIHLFNSRLRSLKLNITDLTKLFFHPVPTIPPETHRLNILIFNWRDIRHIWAGGAEVYVHELALRWVAAGHQVTLFCGTDRQSPADEVIDGVRIIRRGGFYTVYIWAAVYYVFRLRGKYDVVVDSINGIPFFTPLFVRVPKFLLIHHIHQDYFRQHVPFPLSYIAMFLESKLMPLVYRSQPIITVSESSKLDLLKLGRFLPENIHIVNPGLYLKAFRTAAKTSYPSFIYLGRLRTYKNIDVAIKAFARLLVDFPNAVFTIAGTGEDQTRLQRLANRLKLNNSVRFTGKVTEDQKISLLAESWLMLQPSSFEGWGITVLEANACGTPVVASNVVGLRDSVVDDQTGWLVQPKNVESLAWAMYTLVSHPVYLNRLSGNALVWAKNFDWDVNARSFLLILESAVTSRRLKTNFRPHFLPI